MTLLSIGENLGSVVFKLCYVVCRIKIVSRVEISKFLIVLKRDVGIVIIQNL